jgi:hypothetical protein
MAVERHLLIYISLEEAAQLTALSTRNTRRRISDGTIFPPTDWAGVRSASDSATWKGVPAASRHSRQAVPKLLLGKLRGVCQRHFCDPRHEGEVPRAPTINAR